MSTIIAFAQDSVPVLAAVPHVPTQDGLIDLVTDRNRAAQLALRGLALTVAIVFVLYKAVASKLSFGTIIMSGITAGLLVWLVFNVTAIEDRVDNELSSGLTQDHANVWIGQPGDATGLFS